MKHIKLLPILSVSLLVGAIAPIATGCNKTKAFDGTLSKEEIIKAVDNATNPEVWNDTCDATIYSYEELEPTIEGKATYKFNTNGVYEKTSEPEINDETTEYYFKQHNNEWFNISKNDQKYVVDEILGVTPFTVEQLAIWFVLGLIKDYIAQLSFNNEHKGYYYYGPLGSAENVLLFFRFNSNKQLDYCYFEADVVSNSFVNDKIAYDFKFYDYGATKIEFPFKDEDIDYPADTVLEYDSNKHYYTHASNDLNYGCTFKANVNLLSPTKIAIYNLDETLCTYAAIENASIYVNGVKSNCTFASFDEKAEATITGLTLKENDSVQLVWDFGETNPGLYKNLKMRIS